MYIVKKPLDRITEAYYGELGSAFGKNVRDRVNWICEQVEGKNVLDIGCSQGIVSILLAREGKKVLGIDLQQEAIDSANQYLEQEEKPTKELVTFQNANFMSHDFQQQTFDTVIFGEILEHLTNPKEFMRKGKELLNEHGKIIVTVPFGVNDYFDHKKTYYVKGLLDLAVDGLTVTQIKFFGKWIGAIFKLQQDAEKLISINDELVLKMEEEFEKIERNLIDEVKSLKKQIIDFQEKLKEQNKMIAELNNHKDDLAKQLTSQIDRLKEISEKNNTEDRKRLESATKALIEEKKAKIILQQELADTYKYEEQLLKDYKKLSKKYQALRKSKLGRLAIKYWKIKKHFFRGK